MYSSCALPKNIIVLYTTLDKHQLRVEFAWVMCLKIFTSAKFRPPTANTTLQFSIAFMMTLQTLSDILYIFQILSYPVYWTIS